MHRSIEKHISMDNNLEEEEEKLVQMVQDFIESESSNSSNDSSFFPSSSYLECSSSQFTLMEILESGNEFQREVEREVMERVEKHMKKKRKERGSDLKKWMALRLKMDGFAASLCHNSWVTTFSCPAGDYEYIDIQVVTKNNGRRDEEAAFRRLILDLDFRSQFELARPTETYKALTDALPTIFIGDVVKLNGVISLVCSAAKKSLKDRGLHIPPWRTITYMQCKWQLSSPANSGDCGGVAGDRGGETAKEVVVSKQKTSVRDKRRVLGSTGQSGLSSQFSNMRVNCC